MRTRLLLLVAALSVVSSQPAASDLASGYVVTDNGAWIHYLEGGPADPEGPTILFVPGWSMPGWIWEEQLDHFSRSHRVVAMDPRSQGHSSQESEGLYPAGRAADVRAVVKELQLEPVVLVGWSMAVTELLSYVKSYTSDGIAGLVLVDGSGGVGVDSDYIRAAFPWLLNFQVSRIDTTRGFVRSMFVTPQDEVYLERLTEAALKTPTSAAVALSVGAWATDNRDVLAGLDRPTLFVVAPGAYTALMKEQADQIPNRQWFLMENAGHALFVDQAERFNELLAGFLKQLPNKPAASIN